MNHRCSCPKCIDDESDSDCPDNDSEDFRFGNSSDLYSEEDDFQYDVEDDYDDYNDYNDYEYDDETHILDGYRWLFMRAEWISINGNNDYSDYMRDDYSDYPRATNNIIRREDEW